MALSQAATYSTISHVVLVAQWPSAKQTSVRTCWKSVFLFRSIRRKEHIQYSVPPRWMGLFQKDQFKVAFERSGGI